MAKLLKLKKRHYKNEDITFNQKSIMNTSSVFPSSFSLIIYTHRKKKRGNRKYVKELRFIFIRLHFFKWEKWYLTCFENEIEQPKNTFYNTRKKGGKNRMHVIMFMLVLMKMLIFKECLCYKVWRKHGIFTLQSSFIQRWNQSMK